MVVLQVLTASAVEPGLYDYLWNTGATTPDITVFPSNTTTYSVRITNRATGCYNNISRTVTVDALAAPVITGPTSVCRGTAVTLTVSPGTNYLWDDASVTTTQSMTDILGIHGLIQFGLLMLPVVPILKHIPLLLPMLQELLLLVIIRFVKEVRLH